MTLGRLDARRLGKTTEAMRQRAAWAEVEDLASRALSTDYEYDLLGYRDAICQIYGIARKIKGSQKWNLKKN